MVIFIQNSHMLGRWHVLYCSPFYCKVILLIPYHPKDKNTLDTSWINSSSFDVVQRPSDVIFFAEILFLGCNFTFNFTFFSVMFVCNLNRIKLKKQFHFVIVSFKSWSHYRLIILKSHSKYKFGLCQDWCLLLISKKNKQLTQKQWNQKNYNT